MNLPITHLAIVCIVVSSDGREKGKDWASYHPYHRYLIKKTLVVSCLLLLGLLLLLFFLTNMKSLALASQYIGAWLFVLSFFLISQYAQNFTMSKHKQTLEQKQDHCAEESAYQCQFSEWAGWSKVEKTKSTLENSMTARKRDRSMMWGDTLEKVLVIIIIKIKSKCRWDGWESKDEQHFLVQKDSLELWYTGITLFGFDI